MSFIEDRLSGLVGDVSFKLACRCATTANITLSGFQTIDGITLADGDANLRVLVRSQTDPTENGIYDASSSDWTRATDFDGADAVAQYTMTIVAEGDTYEQTFWWVTADTTDVVPGTSELTFTLLGQAFLDNRPDVSGDIAALQDIADQLQATAKFSVFSRTTNAPPVSPSEGDLWIVPAGGSGAWSGHQDKIAWWHDAAWSFLDGDDMPFAYVADESLVVLWNGTSWGSLETETPAIDDNEVTFAMLNSGVYDTDGTLTENSDGVLPTQKAVKTYVDSGSSRSVWKWTETDVAAAATADIGTATTLFVRITGADTITSLGSVVSVYKFVRFAGVCTLTYNATSLILPTSANIQTAAGDAMLAVSDASGNWRVAGYWKADGTPITGYTVSSFNPARTTHGDADTTIASTERVAAITAAFTSGRAYTLPAANALTAGQTLAIIDEVGAVSDSFPLTVTAAGSDTINGRPTLVTRRPYCCVVLETDGTSKWTTEHGFGYRPNFQRNPSFDVWQSGTSFTATGFAADLYSVGVPANRTVSQQTGFSGARYCIRIQRDNGNAVTTLAHISSQLSKELVAALAGKTIVFSADARKGADYSGASTTPALSVVMGTGTEETFNPAGLTFPTGSSTLVSGSSNLVTLGTTAKRIYWAAIAVPSTATELAWRLHASFSGTAGAADYWEITNIKIEVGSIPTPFEPAPLAMTWDSCLRRYRKSFAPDTTPAQNVGTGTGEHVFPAPVAGANTERTPRIYFSPPMRAAPTITLYNPAAANAQVRDETAAADCSASASANVTESGFGITATGNAGTAVGNALGVHWTADARL